VKAVYIFLFLKYMNMQNYTTLIYFFLFFTINHLSAQYTCCLPSTTAPEITSGLHDTLIDISSNTPAIPLAINASSDLPNVEFIISKRHTTAMFKDGSAPDTTGGGGDVIIGGDADGVFSPGSLSRYGITLADNDTFDVTVIGFDLPVMQNLTDSLLNGYALNGSSLDPCCELFLVLSAVVQQPSVAGFCDSVNNAGIYSGADVHGIEQVLDIIDGFSSGQASVEALISIMQTINNSGASISVDCGGTLSNDFVAYGINNALQYSFVVDDPLAVQKLSNVSRFLMYPNPATQKVQINFTSDQQVNMSVSIVNTLGQLLFTNNLGLLSGDYSTEINIEDFPSGIYTVLLSDGNNSNSYMLNVR
jgi:hypothetical protein